MRHPRRAIITSGSLEDEQHIVAHEGKEASAEVHRLPYTFEYLTIWPCSKLFHEQNIGGAPSDASYLIHSTVRYAKHTTGGEGAKVQAWRK